MDIKLVIIGLFLPLFPLSMVFNALYVRLPHPLLRVALLLVWPMIGIYLLAESGQPIPDWIVYWALATSILYGFRLLAVREMGLWISFLATSVWSLQWVAVNAAVEMQVLVHALLGFSMPLAILAIVMRHIESRFGAAYGNLYGGLAMTTPRLSGVLVFAVLAATATPIFPAFFIMLHTLVNATLGVVIAMLIAWLLWGWAGARLLKGLIAGDVVGEKIPDISRAAAWVYGLVLTMFAAAGVVVTGGLL